ncbi:MAG: hypothetical protein HY040_06775 [Planctomycetes bacterium]|nr:hypothetical protein [Planctomycetota bacterium]
MPRPGMAWRHVVISTYNSWLPGDPRGFRSKDHKVHSSGDYKNPPPQGEHAGLHRFSQEISSDKVVIPNDLWPVIGRTIIQKLKEQAIEVLAVSVSATHCHIQAELPVDRKQTKKVIGNCKRAASHKVRDRIPGQIWGLRGKYELIEDKRHQLNVYNYVLKQKDAWIWSFKDPA